MTQEFWHSELGELDATPESSFTKTFSLVPDGTLALAFIESFLLIETDQKKFYEIMWVLNDGEFKGSQVKQKIHAFDEDKNKKHRSLNMFKLLYNLFKITPTSKEAPAMKDLFVFKDKVAGIKVQEWSMTTEDGKFIEGNWVSEVHSGVGFRCETGIKLDNKPDPQPLQPMLSQEQLSQVGMSNDFDIPF